MYRYFPKKHAKANMLGVVACLLFLVSCNGFLPAATTLTTKQQLSKPELWSTTHADDSRDTDRETTSKSNDDEEAPTKTETTSTENSTKPCYWKHKDGPNTKNKNWWIERIKLEDLTIGQELLGHVVQDNLDARTGPKLYFECGIGRINPKTGDWSIVNGMLRLDRGKPSVSKKRAARFRQKDRVPLFVFRIQTECGRLEVCAKIETVEKYNKPKTSVATLKKDQEVVGKVVKVYPYGVIVDIGANVNGLLHISKVARMMNKYVDKEEGLKNAGLERGAKVRLTVESVEKRRLSLDFTDDVKEDSHREREEKEKQKQLSGVDESSSSSSSSDNNLQQSSDELDAWAAYAANEETQKEVGVNNERSSDDAESDDDDYDYDEYDDRYDEEMDIESSLGLDMY